MANGEHLSRLLSSSNENNGCATWNQWRLDNPTTQIDLSNVNLSGSLLTRVDLRRANLRGAHLIHTDLIGAVFIGADFYGAHLARANLSDANFRSADFTNVDFSGALLTRADLSDANFRHANFTGADLKSAHLTHADLMNADLHYTDLTDARLTKVDLRDAKLIDTVFVRADLSHANLRGARLISVICEQTRITAALVDERTFANVNPNGLLDLKTVIYDKIDVSLAQQHDIAPAPLPSLTRSVFIGYSRVDGLFVDTLGGDLQSAGYTTWIDRGQIQGGQGWLREITAAIDNCDTMLVVLSPEAALSDYVESEYLHAHRQKKHIIPIDYRACKIPILLARLHIVDFRTVPYQQAFQSLFSAIQSPDEK